MISSGDGSCMVGVSTASNYVRNKVSTTNAWVQEHWQIDLNQHPSCKGHYNYRSGSDSHFDLAVSPDEFGIPWLDHYAPEKLSKLAGDSTGQNIVLRWIPARCDAWGTWSPGQAACDLEFCDFCEYGNPKRCMGERCVPGSVFNPVDGTCSRLPESGRYD
eukprot:UN13873